MRYKVPKGEIGRDYSYQYQCPCPYGKPCPWCLENDLTDLVKSLRYARGQTYYGNLKSFLAIQGKAIAERVLCYQRKQDRFTPANLLELADEFNFPKSRMKALTEWLEDCKLIKLGTYERLKITPGWKPSKNNS